MTLPDPIQIYCATNAPQDGAALAAAFAPDAIVHDEGATHRGAAEIEAWWAAAKARSRQRAEPLDLTETGGKLLVRARVSGDFPGSPAVLTFAFGLSGSAQEGNRIPTLKIG